MGEDNPFQYTGPKVPGRAMISHGPAVGIDVAGEPLANRIIKAQSPRAAWDQVRLGTGGCDPAQDYPHCSAGKCCVESVKI